MVTMLPIYSLKYVWARPIKIDTSGNMLRIHYPCLLSEFWVKFLKILVKNERQLFSVPYGQQIDFSLISYRSQYWQNTRVQQAEPGICIPLFLIMNSGDCCGYVVVWRSIIKRTKIQYFLIPISMDLLFHPAQLIAVLYLRSH